MRIYLINGVKTGGCGPSHIESPIRSKSQMIGGNAGLQCGKDKHLAVAGNAPDGPSAVANIKALFMVKGNSGGNAHAFGIGAHGAVGRYAVNSALIARRNVHLTLGV